MRVGIGTLLTERSIDIAVLAKRAEELGFESIWVPEQNILPVTTENPVPPALGGHRGPVYRYGQGVGGDVYDKAGHVRECRAGVQPAGTG